MLDDKILRDVFRRLVAEANEWSDDPSTKNAAVVLAEWREMPYWCLGVNHLPWKPTTEDRVRIAIDRPYKLQVMEHAERAAIYSYADSPAAGQVMCCLWATCCDCARAIVLSGIQQVYSLQLPHVERWAESIAVGNMILERGGVTHKRIKFDPPLGVSFLFNGEQLCV